MELSVQYLEGGTSASNISPQAARLRLRDALERVPFTRVLLGWDLDSRVVEACAEECARHHCELYLWQPLLTGHSSFVGHREWRVIALNGNPVPGLEDKAEFTFLCPNRPSVRDRVSQCLSDALATGYYHGVFLDRIRFPSPAAKLAAQFACFCGACREAAHDAALDLEAVRQAASRLLRSSDGRHAIIREMLSASGTRDAETDAHLLARMLEFRERSVTRFVAEIAHAARSKGLKVGLDCFSPALARMVGQDLGALSKSADWTKVMTYVRAFAPASLPYEIVGLANCLQSFAGESEQQALDCLAASASCSLPSSLAAIRSGGLPSSVLTREIERGRSAGVLSLLAGIELVEMPGVSHLTPSQIQEDASALFAGQPDGVVLCWDLWRMPLERVELAGSLYGRHD